MTDSEKVGVLMPTKELLNKLWLEIARKETQNSDGSSNAKTKILSFITHKQHAKANAFVSRCYVAVVHAGLKREVELRSSDLNCFIKA